MGRWDGRDGQLAKQELESAQQTGYANPPYPCMCTHVPLRTIYILLFYNMSDIISVGNHLKVGVRSDIRHAGGHYLRVIKIMMYCYR